MLEPIFYAIGSNVIPRIVISEIESIIKIYPVSMYLSNGLGLIPEFLHPDYYLCYPGVILLPYNEVTSMCMYIKCSCSNDIKFFKVIDDTNLKWLSERWFVSRRMVRDNKFASHVDEIFNATNFRWSRTDDEYDSLISYYSLLYTDYTEAYGNDGSRYVLEEWMQCVCDEINKKIEIIG